MGNFIDLTGQRFGSWTAIMPIRKTIRKKQQIYWQCKCDCGKSKEVLGESLRRGNSKSCGCYISLNSKPKINLTGERFGKWTVIKPIKKTIGKKQYYFWECKCDCGKVVDVRGGHLRSGNSKSCGCNIIINAKKAQERNIKEGTHLTVIKSKVANSNTGVRGVYNTKNGTFHAKITFKKKVYELGTYKTLEEAIAVRKAAEESFFKPILEKYNEV